MTTPGSEHAQNCYVTLMITRGNCRISLSIAIVTRLDIKEVIHVELHTLLGRAVYVYDGDIIGE